MALSSMLRMVNTFTALPSVPAISPQASFGNSRSPCSTISLAKRVSSSTIATAITVAAGCYSLNRRSVRHEPALDGDVARLAGLGEADLDGLDPPLHQAKPHVLGVGGGDQQAAGGLGVGQTSGGLLIAATDPEDMRLRLVERGVQAVEVGLTEAGEPGHITLEGR